MKLQKANGSGSRLKTLLVFVAMCAVASWCGATAYSWKPDESDPDGVLTNAVHFYNSAGTASVNPSVITAADYLNFRGVASEQVLVTVPSNAVVTTAHGTYFMPQQGGVLKVDASGAVWRQPDLPADAAIQYDNYAKFRICNKGAGKFFYQYYNNSKFGAFMLSNAVFRVSCDSEDNHAFDLDQGLLDCYSPNGVNRPSSNIYFMESGNAAYPSAAMRFHAGSCVRFPYLVVYAVAPSNEFLFDGGDKHFIYYFRVRSNGSADNVADRTKLTVTGQDTKLSIENFGWTQGSGLTSGHRYRVSVRNGATLSVLGSITQIARANLPSGMEDVVSLENGGRLVFDKTSTFTWSDASLAATNAVLDASHGTLSMGGSSARLRLKNTEWLVKSVTHANTCTDGVLTADGSTIRVVAANASLDGGFSTAACGADGLTIDSNYAVTVPQSFSNLDGANGELILTGAGTKTLSGTATTVSRIVVAGGTVVFAATARATSELVVTNGAKVVFAGDPSDVGLTGLVLGDAATVGVMRFSAGQTLAVAGDVTVNNAKIELADDFAIGTTANLLSASGTVSAASRAAWAAAFVGAGSVSGRDYVFGAVESGGGVSFRMAVVEAPALLIEQKTGNGTYSADYPFGQNARLTVAVSNDATLAVTGLLGDGALDKVGGGKLYLQNANNLLRGGITSAAGLFSVPSVAALGYDANGVGEFILRGGTLEFSSALPETYPGVITVDAGFKKAAVVKNAGNLTVGGLSVASGDFVKRGPGTLVIQPGPDTTTQLTFDSGNSSNNWDPATKAADLDDSGAAPTTGYMGLNVAEGELLLKGDSSTVFNVTNGILVGLQTSAGTAQPALTVDGAKVTTASSPLFGLGNYQTDESLVQFPRFTVRNGANVSLGIFVAGRGIDDATFSRSSYPTTVVENATLSIGSFRGSHYWKVINSLLVTNSSLLVYSIETYGPNNLDVVDSVMQRSDGSCIEAKIYGTTEGTWRFRAGSRLALSKFTAGAKLQAGSSGLNFVFDGATWETGGGATPTFHLYRSESFTFRTTGAGLTLPVASGKTVNVARAIVGDGPLVKTGAGALAFETQGTWDSEITTKTALDDSVSLAFTGELDVRGGTVSVESGACREGGAYRAAEGTSVDFGGNALGHASFAGAGSFSNFSATGATIVSDGEGGIVPTFSSASFGGVTRVDFGRTEADPLDWQGVVNLPVARFVGAAPDVTRWKVSGTGVKNIGGKFSVGEDGEVRVTLVRRGITIVVL